MWIKETDFSEGGCSALPVEQVSDVSSDQFRSTQTHHLFLKMLATTACVDTGVAALH